jgi:3-hydroxybutyryl-CoA dehydrogenase
MKVGVVGLGKMGSSIFKLLADRGFEITVVEQNAELLNSSSDIFFQKLERSLRRQKISDIEIDLRKARYHFSQHLTALAETDIVIEAVFENYDLKAHVFKQLESVVHKDTILLTNSSSISIHALENELNHPERFCGYHFFHPIILIDLIEIIRTSQTPEWLIIKLQDFSQQLGKKHIVVSDGPGSVINALLVYYYAEAVYILEEGIAPPSQIDHSARSFFYVGPCESLDVIGVDLFLSGLQLTESPLVPLRRPCPGQEHLPQEEIGGRKGFYYPHIIDRMLAEKRLGKKTGAGLYRYDKALAVDENREFYVDLKRSSQNNHTEDPKDIISSRLLFALFAGVLYSLELKKGSVEEIDYGVQTILQMKSGPVSMMKKMGYQKVVDGFRDMTERFGSRFQVADMQHLFTDCLSKLKNTGADDAQLLDKGNES